MEQVLQELIVLTGYTDRDAQTLAESAETLQTWADEVTQVFYDTLYGHDSTIAVFSNGERPDREKTLVDWYQRVVQGQIDADFWRRQCFVGLIHIPHDGTECWSKSESN